MDVPARQLTQCSQGDVRPGCDLGITQQCNGKLHDARARMRDLRRKRAEWGFFVAERSDDAGWYGPGAELCGGHAEALSLVLCT